MISKQSSVAVIGAGISGLAAAIELAHQGFKVDVFEKNECAGGRGRAFEESGFRFDMGPSWYWMPDVFEQFFNDYGKSTSDYFKLIRLDPSYQIIFHDKRIVIPADINQTFDLFDQIEPGSSAFLKKFIADSKYKYEAGMNEFVRKPSIHFKEYLDWRLLKSVFKMDLLTSLQRLISRGIKNEQLRQCLCFPVLFLGAKPADTPALYSLMNYADYILGTWYPEGGLTKLFEGMHALAVEKGVSFHFNAPVEHIAVEDKKVKGIKVHGEVKLFDAVLSTADYHHTESKLLDKQNRQYSDSYWQNRVVAPSALIYYLGFGERLENLMHHNLFFHSDLNKHISDIYDRKVWPSDPCFYVCIPSITDPTVAPEGKENVFVLVPVTAGIVESETDKSRIYDGIINQLEIQTGQKLRDKVVYKKEMSVADFEREYNSFKGNAYGLANTLFQTAFLKPKLKHKFVNGLYYAGQFAHPGPGLPPSLISGQISAKLLIKEFNA